MKLARHTFSLDRNRIILPAKGCGCELCESIRSRRRNTFMTKWTANVKTAFFYFVMFQAFEMLLSLIKRLLP